MLKYAEMVESDLMDALKDTPPLDVETVADMMRAPACLRDISQALFEFGEDYSVTGSPSGSYYCNRARAEEAVRGDFYGAYSAYAAIGDGAGFAEAMDMDEWETIDVRARGFALYSAADRAALRYMRCFESGRFDLIESGDVYAIDGAEV